MKRDLRSINDLSLDDIEEIFQISAKLKMKLKDGVFPKLLQNKTLAMIFEKPSLRTRCTFEIGMFQLGGHAIYLQPSDIGLGKRESIYDISKNLERWFDIVMARTFKQDSVDRLAQNALIPVINALSDEEHPCQAMGDLLTLKEHKQQLKGLTLAYIGDGNNICQSLLLLCPKLGVNITIASPKGYEPKKQFVEKAIESAKETNTNITITNDPAEAVENADAIYTDVWASMGQESESEDRKKIFAPFQVNEALVAKAPAGVLIMHDLPAHRGEEITDAVIDSENSIVFDQAENRLHIQKGIMVFLHEKSIEAL